MNPSALKLVGCACAVLALGLIFLLNGREWRDVLQSDGNAAPVTKKFPRDHDRLGARAGRTKNPREEFEAARKLGLSKEEVRWIVEDFVAAGLVGMEIDTNSDEELFKMRERVIDWYLVLLGEGFEWTEEQETEARAKISETAESNNDRYLLLVQVSINWIVSRDRPNQQDVMDAATKVAIDFVGKSIVPGKLCDLDEAQKGITGFQDENGQWVAMNYDSLTLDYGTDKKYAVENPSPYCGVLIPAGRIFPLSMKQVELIRSSKTFSLPSGGELLGKPTILDQVKFLTAPQLKTLLLYLPDVAGQIMEDLEKRGSVGARGRRIIAKRAIGMAMDE